MTAQRAADVDIEALRKIARRPLDTCLVVSVVILFMMVAAITAVIALIVKQPPAIAVQKGDSFPPTYKMGNFVYLEATSSKLENVTMTWAVKDYGEGTSKGNLFDFYPELHCLQPKRAGTYFIYVNLNFTCTEKNNCASGRLTVQVGDKLTCEVDLRSEEMRHTRKCWAVTHMNSQNLLAQMTVPKAGLKNWKLELQGSGLGAFLVD